jgi:nicotianamine synthase
VFTDDAIRSLAPAIHRVRAAYERDKELVQARNLVESADAASRLKSIIERESYWAMGSELRQALAGTRHVLVAGSGPLPLTALSIGANLDVRVTCVERDAECHDLGHALIALSELGHRIASRKGDILEMDDFDAYDAIVGVVLLGVNVEGEQASAKARIARHIIEYMAPGTRLVLRDPHGLGRLLYPSVMLEESDAVSVVRHVPEVGPTRPYRSGLVVAERRSPERGHAH